MANNNQQSGKMSVNEAGKRGGEQTAKTHDSKFYQTIGREGGAARGKDHKRKNE